MLHQTQNFFTKVLFSSFFSVLILCS